MRWLPWIALCAHLAALAACSRSRGQDLVLYTGNGPEVTDPILDAFRASHPDIDLSVVSIPGSGEMFARTEAEKASPAADVLWGGPSSVYASHADLFEPVVLPGDEHTVERDPAHVWHAVDLLFQAIAVNTERFPDASRYPTSFASLVAPDWAGGEIAFADPHSSATTYSLLTTMVTLHGWPYVDAFVKRASLLYDSASMFTFVRDGEVSVSFINEDLGGQWIEFGVPLAMIYPSDGVSHQVGAIGVVAHAPHRAAALELADFLLSFDAQSIMVESVGRRSSRDDVPVPHNLAPAGTLHLVTPDPAWVSQHKAEILARFEIATDEAD